MLCYDKTIVGKDRQSTVSFIINDLYRLTGVWHLIFSSLNNFL